MKKDTQTQNHKQLENADFLVWRVTQYQRQKREEDIKNIFYTRERLRNTHH